MSTSAENTERVGGLRLAAGLFSLLPARPVAHIDREAGARAIAWFPWLGILLGLISAAVMLLAELIGAAPLLRAVLGITVLQLVTGFMHLDGIADTADGLGARKPNQDALTIMKKSDIGPMGVAAIALVLLVDVAALGQPLLRFGDVALMALAPMVGRTSTVLATAHWVPCARPGGFGSLFAGATSTARAAGTVTAATIVSAAVGWTLRGPLAALILAASCILALLVAHVWQRQLVARFKGLTGDMYGALIELATAVFLVLGGSLL